MAIPTLRDGIKEELAKYKDIKSLLKISPRINKKDILTAVYIGAALSSIGCAPITIPISIITTGIQYLYIANRTKRENEIDEVLTRITPDLLRVCLTKKI